MKMMKSFKKGRFGVGYAWLPTNYHGKDGATLKSTARLYDIYTGKRLTFYTSRGHFLELDVYWKKTK